MKKSLLGVALFMAIILWRPWLNDHSPQIAEPTPLPKENALPLNQALPSPQEESKQPEQPKAPNKADLLSPPSPLIQELHAPDGTVARDLRILQNIFTDYRLSVKTGNPSGTNAEITAALTGKNKFYLAPIPPNYAAISEKGELLDRFGKPYFFHNLSANTLEIQTTGPDGRHHTSDDIKLSNASH